MISRVIRTTATLLAVAQMLCTPLAYAQNIHQGEVFELNTPLNSQESHAYTASNYIELKKGFFSEPNTGNTTLLKLDTEGYGVYPPEEGLINSNGRVVGTLGGTVDISAMGGLLYSIPLELPSGINGMQPSLSITYNSQAGNGLMGWGWNLDGLSSITRTGKTLYHDGMMTTANISWNDRFLLDGQRLIVVAGYRDSIEYRIEQDCMSKIMAYITHKQVGLPFLFGNETVDVLDHFVVWKADGLILEYGVTEDSWIEPQNGGNDALCWLLSKVSDRNGNSIVYHYHEDQDNGNYYIQSIEYTVNDTQETSAQFIVSFGFRNRSDYEQYYLGGNFIRFIQLLESIQVTQKNGSKLLCKYDFYYNYFNSGHHYNRLRTIEMTSYDDNGNPEQFNATTINWNGKIPISFVQTPIANPEIFDSFPFTGDFNGDGYTDVAMVPYKNDTYYPGTVDIEVYLNDRNQGFIYSPSRKIEGLAATLDWVYVLDIDGDGLDDIIPFFCHTTPSVGTFTSVLVYRNNPLSEGFDGIGGEIIGHKGEVIVGDFDGNGNSDLILLEKIKGTVDTTLTYIENAFHIGCQGSQLLVRKLNEQSLESLGPVFSATAADFNGDGISEVLLLGKRETGDPFSGTKLGKFLYNDSNDCFFIMQYCNACYPNYNPSENIWCHILTGDFNGDGKTDIIFYDDRWHICFSKGNVLDYPHEIHGTYLPELHQYHNLFYPSLSRLHSGTNQYTVSVTVSDFDGDGCADVGFTKVSESKFYIESKITMIANGPRMFQQRSVSNGFMFRSQFIHVGNFLGSDNTSFLAKVRPINGGGNGTVKICSLPSVNEYNSVTCITDGLGNATRFTYDCLIPKSPGTTNPFYTYNYSAPDAYGVCPVPLAIRALKTCSVEGVNNSKLITKYHYQNAMYHKNGHGFMGFGLTTVETHRNSLDSLWSTRKVSFYESATMGQHAMLLPYREISYVNSNGEARAVNRTQYGFEKVKLSNGLTDLVVCPALVNKTEELYSIDEEDDLITTVTTSYQYNYNSNHTYSDTYGCISTNQRVVGYENRSQSRELLTEKRTALQNNVAKWILNRPVNETVVRTRDEESVATFTEYSYVSPASYQPRSITVTPNDGTQPDDPLTTLTTYEYDAFGNVTEVQIAAPNGIHDEIPRRVSYEYDEAYQHRLLTKKKLGQQNDGYVTQYEYDFHDRLVSTTDCNGKQTVSDIGILGTNHRIFMPDVTEQLTQTLWADKSPYKPIGASYYTWSKKTGGITTMAFYHKSGSELRNVTFDFHGEPIYTDKRYNAKGLLERVSAPYRSSEPEENIQWTVYHYDSHDRTTQIDYPDGSIKTIAYYGFETTVTVTPPDGGQVTAPQTTVSKNNALGWLRESVDAEGISVFYEYYPDGNLKWTRIGNDESTKITMEYDHAGNRTRLHDPDYCTAQKDLVSEYNAFGEEVNRTTPKDFHMSFEYDGFGRLVEREEEDEIEPGLVEVRNTSWNYSETVPTKGLLQSVAYPGQTVIYQYDTCQRMSSETVQFSGGETHVTQYGYDKASRIASVTYPSGFTVNQRYNSRGYPSVQTDTCGNELYRTKGTTPTGQTERFVLGGALANTFEYDPEKHLLTGILSTKNNDTIQNFSYNYDGFCNLASRKDNMSNLEETFEYDSQNRLKKVRLGPTLTGASVYDSYGRMTAKTANGQLIFYNAEFGTTAKPHAMDAATTVAENFPQVTQTITYTGFDKVSKVKQGNDSLCYTYGYDHQRILMEEHVGNRHRTKRYVGNCEYITKTNGNVTDTQWLTYLTGPTGVYAVVATENGREKIHYIMKDNLGSWTTITDEEGSVEQYLNYDAWGNLRNPNYWTGFFSGVPMFDRGYTGHEHLSSFGLINMNGRMYDPVMSSFLSVDQYVSSPENAQGFNRYAYCMNNPLRYVDPSGWLPVGGGGHGYTPNSATNDPYAYVDNRYLEPRDFCSAYGMFNMEFYGNTSGFGAGIGAGGGYLGSYGYQVTHRANSVYNHYFKTALLSLIQDWQANPSRSTGEALVNAGITNLTVGEVYGSYQGDSGYRNSYYSWTDGNGKTHTAEVLYGYVGGNANGVFIVSNLPLDLYGTMTSLEKANILAQSLGVPMGTISEGMEMAAKSYHNIPLLKAFSGLNKAQKIAAISKEGVGLLKMAKGLGVAGAAVSSGISVYEMANYKRNGGLNSDVYVKGTLDLVMTGVSFIGPVGLAIGMTYFIIDLSTDSFGGWGKIP